MSRIYIDNEPTGKGRVCSQCHKPYVDSISNFKEIHRHNGMCPKCSTRFK